MRESLSLRRLHIFSFLPFSTLSSLSCRFFSISDVPVFQVAFFHVVCEVAGKKKKKEKKLIFLNALGNSLIPDKLPRKALKWLSLPQRQGCENWKGFHFWLFQLLQKEIFSGVWSLKTVTEQIKIRKLSVCEHHGMLHRECVGCSGMGAARRAQQLQGLYRKGTQIVGLESTWLDWSVCSSPVYFQKEKGKIEWMEKLWEDMEEAMLLMEHRSILEQGVSNSPLNPDPFDCLTFL